MSRGVPRPRPPRRTAAQVAAAQGPAQRAAWGFLIGAVLCFSFFSWYPIVREVIMSFQKPVYGGGYAWDGVVELPPDIP